MASGARIVVAWASLAGLVPGCVPSLQHNQARDPRLDLPGRFSPPAGLASSHEPVGPSNLARATYTEFFADPALRALIQEAMDHNQDLNIGLQDIILARTEAGRSRGAVLPQVDAKAGVGLEKVGRYTSQGVSDEAHRVAGNLGDLGFGLVASWEVDIWRRLRDARDAADVRYLASIESRNFMVTQVIAEVARAYYDMVATDRQLELLRGNLDLQASALAMISLEKQAARVTELAVQRFEAEVFRNRSRLYALKQERVQAENRINFLLGRVARPLAAATDSLGAHLPDLPQAGLPFDLLANRPDVRQAELTMAASKLDVSAARAAFYPALRVGAGAGFRAFNPKHLLLTPASLVYDITGNLVAPLLNRAAIIADYQGANARQIEAVLGYEKAVLQAFTEVANQLAMLDNLRQFYELKAAQVATLQRAVDASTMLFQSARADYMEVLLTRRDYLDAHMELVEGQKQRYQALVGLYQALGGGWRPAESARR